jgi:hypothetical protein
MNNRKKEHNVWNKNRNIKRNNASQNLPLPGELKFKEAHGKLQAAIQKHVKGYESSSSEEELESENIIGL